MRQIFTTLAVVCAIALVVSLSLLIGFPAEHKKVQGATSATDSRQTATGLSDLELHTLGYEILKSTVQLALTGFIGGMLLQMYSRRNAEKGAKNARRKDFLNRVADAEGDLRRSRLKLRANTRRGEPHGGSVIAWPVYESQLECISETFHNVKDMEVRGGYLDNHFRGITDLLRKNLKALAKYLDGLRDEYRDVAMNTTTSLGGSEKVVPLDALPAVSRFMSADGDYETCTDLLGKMRLLMEHYIALKEKWRFSDSRRTIRREIQLLIEKYG